MSDFGAQVDPKGSAFGAIFVTFWVRAQFRGKHFRLDETSLEEVQGGPKRHQGRVFFRGRFRGGFPDAPFPDSADFWASLGVPWGAPWRSKTHFWRVSGQRPEKASFRGGRRQWSEGRCGGGFPFGRILVRISPEEWLPRLRQAFRPGAAYMMCGALPPTLKNLYGLFTYIV